jgi:hypothetical protein
MPLGRFFYTLSGVSSQHHFGILGLAGRMFNQPSSGQANGSSLQGAVFALDLCETTTHVDRHSSDSARTAYFLAPVTPNQTRIARRSLFAAAAADQI